MFKLLTLNILLILVLFSSAQPVINSVTENNNSIGKYNKLELTVNLTATFTNPYNYSEINLKTIFISPSGEKDTVDGFYYQDYNIVSETTGELITNGTPEWKVRFSPTEIGVWQYQVYCTDANGISNIESQDFECVASNSKGYIRVANNMFLKYDDGSQFFAIGENLCWNVNSMGGVDVNQTFVNYSEWLDTLTVYNGNYFRLWMSDWAFALEWNDTGLRDYSNRQDNAFYLDWVVEYAETKDAYLELCLNHHGQFVASGGDAIWSGNPYNSANGGPCTSSNEFFTNTDAKNHYKNRLRYINARWGYSTSILAWEQFNEMDLIGSYYTYKTDIANWTIEMANYIKSIDVNNHLNSTSFVSDTKGFDIWNADVIDYTQTHHYSADAEIELALNNRTHNFLTNFDKPTKIGEYSLSTNGASVVIGYDDSAIHVHNATWSTALSGSFGISMSWWWKWYVHNQDPELQAYKNFEGVGNYISSINLLESPLTPIDFNCEANTSSAFYITPTFGWGLAPENTFTVNTDGSLIPTVDNLSMYLYGIVNNTSNRNPPTFNVSYSQDGFFTVRTGDSSNDSPTVEIWLDGNKVSDQNALANSDYTIAVPSGTHEIFIDNQGRDWIKIDQYYSSYGSASFNAKSNGLICNNAAYGWVHNRDYNWQYISNNGEPNPITNARVVVPGLDDGSYNISIYNTITGEISSQNVVESISGILYVNIPTMLWDYAFKVTELSSTAIENKKSSNTISVYPNPVSSVLRIKGLSENANITVFDVCGKNLFSQELTSNTVDLSSLKKGIYIVNITSERVSSNFKILKK